MKISQFAHIACPAAAFAALLLTATLPAAAQSGAQTSAQTSGQPAAPAAQSPVVASAVGAITLPVTAVNDKGDPVKGLTAADLKLTDNGSAQTIQSISPAVTTPVDFGIIGQTSSGLKFELGDMRLAGVRCTTPSISSALRSSARKTTAGTAAIRAPASITPAAARSTTPSTSPPRRS
jgi:hypothetical protein